MPHKFDMDSLDPEVREYIGELRTEAAKYRTERNDWRDKYSEAGEALREANSKFKDFETLQETHEKFLTEHETVQEKALRFEAALKTGVPYEDVPRLKGKTLEELEADGKSFAERLSGGTTKPTSGPPKDPAAGDPPKDPITDPILAAFDKALGVNSE